MYIIKVKIDIILLMQVYILLSMEWIGTIPKVLGRLVYQAWCSVIRYGEDQLQLSRFAQIYEYILLVQLIPEVPCAHTVYTRVCRQCVLYITTSPYRLRLHQFERLNNRQVCTISSFIDKVSIILCQRQVRKFF